MAQPPSPHAITGSLSLPRECAEILRTEDDVARRAERGLRHDFVWARDRFRRAFERQRRPDQVGLAPGAWAKAIPAVSSAAAAKVMCFMAARLYNSWQET